MSIHRSMSICPFFWGGLQCPRSLCLPLTERMNQEPENTLRCPSSQNPSFWSPQLLWAKYAHNTIFFSSTGLLELLGRCLCPRYPNHLLDLTVSCLCLGFSTCLLPLEFIPPPVQGLCSCRRGSRRMPTTPQPPTPKLNCGCSSIKHL